MTRSNWAAASADLRRGQVEEVGGRRRLDLLQGPAEPQDRVLEDVVGLLPAMHAGEIPEHLPRQAGQPVHRVGQELVARGGVARPQPVNAPLDLRRTLVLRHEDRAPGNPQLPVRLDATWVSSDPDAIDGCYANSAGVSSPCGAAAAYNGWPAWPW
jgi:hypothetical protein